MFALGPTLTTIHTQPSPAPWGPSSRAPWGLTTPPQLLTMIPLIRLSGSSIFGTPDFATRWRVAAQGVLGGFLLLTIFEAVSRMPLGDCTAIFFSSPAFTMILSFIILKDHCGLLRVLVACVLLTGVLVLTRPPALFPSGAEAPLPAPGNTTDSTADPDNYDLTGILSALAVPALSAWIVIITRQE